MLSFLFFFFFKEEVFTGGTYWKASWASAKQARGEATQSDPLGSPSHLPVTAHLK